jgi:DnaJ-class molecular chaperone
MKTPWLPKSNQKNKLKCKTCRGRGQVEMFAWFCSEIRKCVKCGGKGFIN